MIIKMKKGILFIILLHLSLSGSAQTKVDVRQIGYNEIIVADTLYSRHSQQYQAIETLLNLKMNGIDASMIPAPMKVFAEVGNDVLYDTIYEYKEVDQITFDGKQYKAEDFIGVYQENEIDTILATECFEDFDKKIWMWTTESTVWIPFKETGFSHVQVDSLPIWKKKYQNKWRLEQNKSRVESKTEYRELDMPFQFFVSDSISSVGQTSIKVKVFANEDWYPMQYINDVLYFDGSEYTPGFQDFDGYPTRRHTLLFDGLNPNTEYTLKIIGYSRLRDETDEAIFTITTLP